MQWLKTVVLPPWEMKMEKILVPGQFRQKVHKATSQPMAEWNGTHLSSQLLREVQIGEWQSRLALAQKEALSQK
jgi:hypothetical protein